MGSAAFSLIELLVVISIVAVLASLLLVAIPLVKSSIKQTQCLSNQHQLYLAMASYHADFDELVPLTSGTTVMKEPFWNQLLLAYVDADTNYIQWKLRTPWKMPRVFYDPAANHNYLRGDIGVMYDDVVGPIRNTKPSLTLATIRHQGSTILLASVQQFMADGTPIGSWFSPNTAAPQGVFTIPEIADRHRGGAIATFADGHTVWLLRSGLYATYLPFTNK